MNFLNFIADLLTTMFDFHRHRMKPRRFFSLGFVVFCVLITLLTHWWHYLR